MKLKVETNGVLFADKQKHDAVVSIIENSAPHVFRHVGVEVVGDECFAFVTLKIPAFLCGDFHVNRVHIYAYNGMKVDHRKVKKDGIIICMGLSASVFNLINKREEKLTFKITKE